MTGLAALGHRGMHVLPGEGFCFVTGKTGLGLLLLQQARECRVMGIMAGIALALFNRRMQVGLPLEGLLHLLVAGETESGLNLFQVDPADQAMWTVASFALLLADRLVNTALT